MTRLLRSLLACAGAAVLLAPLALSAQVRHGRIVGRVIDVSTGLGLPDVGVQIVGTMQGTATGVDGRFAIANIDAGTVTIHLRRIGFTPKTVTGLMLEGGQSLEQNISLEPASFRLTAQVVTAAAERGTVSEALDQQRNSSGVVSAVTAEQIQKSPDGNAAQAVQRVSGVTVQDGKYVFVRGLGERYTTSSLNGSRVPSPEPEKRVVPLDLFPAGLLQSITTTKTFTPDQSGDFSGAQVDIKTREFPAARSYSAQFGSGYAAGATGRALSLAQSVGGERFALVGSKRALPPLLREVGNFQGLNLSQGDKNLLVSQFRNAWSPQAATGAPNVSGSFAVGGDDPVLFGHRLGYLVSGTLSQGLDVKSDQVRALADRGTVKGSTNEIDRFSGETTSQSVLWGGLANLSTMAGRHTRLLFNAIYNRSADNTTRIERGSFENEGIDARIQRMQYVERAVRSLQLGAEHSMGEAHILDWTVTDSRVNRDEPDRSEFVQQIERDTPASPETLRWLSTGNGGAVRTFSALDETNREARANYQFTFGPAGAQHRVKIGGLTRQTDRDADTRAYSISAPGASNTLRELRPEQIFDGRFATAASRVFDIAPLAQGGSYGARDRLAAAYLMGEWAATARLKVIGGARAEWDHLDVQAVSTLGAPIATAKRWNDLLPSLALTLTLPRDQQLRLSASRTLARPEYRELSPIKSRDVLNGDDVQGNDQLERTRVVNLDARWEWYPHASEVLSVAVFHKTFDQPIERVYRAAGSGTRTVFYTNARRAENLGVELEARKSLAFMAEVLRSLQAFANLTVMQSRIELAANTQASATNLKRRMVGQAPYVLNSGLTWVNQSGSASATVLFNVVGDRIDAAGDAPLPDVIERARRVLDFSLRVPISGSLSARLDAKNLLDAPYRTTQGTVTRESYRVGRVVQAGLSWRP
ncbi:MAG TPA: TonB-dependent receptor [Gemmatimonadaceae bacterium]|jgi:outer membrane receptor protein involved in Fe transport